MTTSEIIAKLQATFEREGVAVEVLEERGDCLHLRAKRMGAGAPIALLVKAVAGTFKRYHATVREVVLDEYDPGEDIPSLAGSSPDFQQVLRHGLKGASPLSPRGHEWLGLDLAGTDRIEAIQALENAHRIWSGQGHERFLVRGLEQEPVHRAWEKWKAFYGLVRSSHPCAESGAVVVHLQEECDRSECLEGGSVVWMPARYILPISPPGPGE